MNNAELSNFYAGIREVYRLIRVGDEIVKSIGAGDLIEAIPSGMPVGESLEEREARDCKAAPIPAPASVIWKAKLLACRNQEEEAFVRGDMWWYNMTKQEREDYLNNPEEDDEMYGRGDELYHQWLESELAHRRFKTNPEIGRLDELMLYREAICPFGLDKCVCGLCQGLGELISRFHG